MSDLVLYRGSGEWSALYVDGKLDRVGDHYLADERIAELAGVKIIDSDDFLRGGQARGMVANTLGEVTEFTEVRERAQHEAVRLRQQALDLQAQAAEIERQHGLSR